MMNKFRSLSIPTQILVSAILIALGIFGFSKGMTYIFKSNNPVNDEFVFISLSDIDDAYEHSGDYVEYMIADHNPEYIFSTVENYMSSKLDKDIKPIVSGIYYNKNNDKTIYEVALINMNDKRDIEYVLIDDVDQKIYDADTQRVKETDNNMKKELDKIENKYIKLQNKYMKEHKDSCIISEDYLCEIIKEVIDITSIRFLDLIEKEQNMFYKLDINYDNGSSGIVLVNARTGSIYK